MCIGNALICQSYNNERINEPQVVTSGCSVNGMETSEYAYKRPNALSVADMFYQWPGAFDECKYEIGNYEVVKTLVETHGEVLFALYKVSADDEKQRNVKRI